MRWVVVSPEEGIDLLMAPTGGVLCAPIKPSRSAPAQSRSAAAHNVSRETRGRRRTAHPLAVQTDPEMEGSMMPNWPGELRGRGRGAFRRAPT